MISTILYLISVCSLIIVVTIGAVLYRRYILDKPRRVRNAVRIMQMACIGASGLSNVSAIRNASFNPDKQSKISRSAAIAQAVVRTQTAIAYVAKEIESPPMYKYA